MSDRAATQVKFNELLEQYRNEILPDTYQNYDKLSEPEQLCVSKLANFFCSLHSLVHMADACSKSLKEAEKGMFETQPPIFERSFLKATEPGAVRLVRTACKAIAGGADEKSGCHGQFTAYMYI